MFHCIILGFISFMMFESVLKEMLEDRGYAVENFHNSGPYLHSVYKKPDDKLIAVFVLLDGMKTDMVGVKEMRQIKLWMVENELSHGLLISKGGVNHYTVKEIRAWEDVHMELFKASELQVNITHSCYYQQHKLVPHDKSLHIIRRYAGVDKLPRLQISDPVVRYFGWRVGDIIEVRPTYGGCEFDKIYNVVCHAQ